MGRLRRWFQEDKLGGQLVRRIGSILLIAIGLVLVLGTPKSQVDQIENRVLGGLALAVGIAVLIYTLSLDLQVWRLRRPQRALARDVRRLARSGRVLRVPRMGAPPRVGVSPAQLHSIEHDAQAMMTLPWGEEPTVSGDEGYRIMQATIPRVRGVAGNWGELVEPVETFVQLPQPWCYIGAAEVLLRLAYQRRGAYSPTGLHLGALFVALAQLSEFAQPDALVIRAKLLAAGGNRRWLRLAEETLALLRRMAPNHPRLPNAEALLYEQRGQRSQALEAYERALANPPSREEYVRDLASTAMLLYRMGRREDALQLNEQALTINPNDPWIWHNQSLILLDLKRFDEARRCNERALEIMEFPAARDIRKLYGFRWR